MSSAVILGGSVVGSVFALQLARSGWQVTVVDPELDRFAAPDAPLSSRPGAPHTVQAHGFMARTLHELTTRLPDVRAAMFDAGAPVVPLAEMVPPPLYDGGRDGDAELACLRARRLVLDRVVGGIVAREPGVTRIHEKATGLLVDESGAVPLVEGLVLTDGTAVRVDVTVDAGGRRSPVSGWLAAAGVAQPVRTDEAVARYYTRHYRYDVAAAPRLNSGFAHVLAYPSLVQLLFLGDNGTAMQAMSVHDADPTLTLLRRADAFDAVLAASPGLAEWRAVMEPISEVFCLGAFDNRMRALVADDRPLVRGLHQIGDALAMTNPTRGRGVAMGVASAGRLHDLLVSDGRDPDSVALAFDAWRGRALGAYYRESASSDTVMAQRLRAGLAGQAVPGNAPAVELPDGHPIGSADLERAAGLDPDLFRVLLRATMLLDDDRDVASPQVADRVRAVLATAPPAADPQPEPTDGLHDRATLEALLAPYA